jgi:hypothetical protein
MLQSIQALWMPTNWKSVARFKLNTLKQKAVRWLTSTPIYEPSNSIEAYIANGVYLTSREAKVNGKFSPAVFVRFSEEAQHTEALTGSKAYLLVNGDVYFVNLDDEIDPRDLPISLAGELSVEASPGDTGISVDYFIGIYYDVMYVVSRYGNYTFFTQGTQSATTR